MEKEEKVLWSYNGFAEAGRKHKEKDILCQDRIAYNCQGKRQAIALVDGIGKTDKNVLAGERIAEYLAEVSVEKFALLMENANNDIKEILLRDIYRIIEKLMKEYSMPKGEFASTLMALTIDHETDCYCAIHLGDGIIACIDGEIEILSYPDNGFCANQTYLTTSENALQQMKIFWGSVENKTKFILVSDGGYEGVSFQEGIAKIVNDELFGTCTEDDWGFVCLSK